MTTTSLDRDAWITAALEVLLADGPDAVAVQPLARRLATTKGSFYWHFSGRDDLLDATLQEWERQATDEVIIAVEATGGTPAERMRTLFARVTEASERSPGQLRLLAAADHPAVSAVLERTTSRRLDYLARLFREHGLARGVARQRAVLAYATYLGHAQLVQATPGVVPIGRAARRRLLEEMSALFLRA